MKDGYGRTIDYLRISVTDRCNLRCFYCMPEEGIPIKSSTEILTYEEILFIVKAGLSLGINRIRITGGEPLVRRGITTFVKHLSALSGITDISMTTNGILLHDMAEDLFQAGLKRINISLDTLQPERFYHLTGVHGFQQVWQGMKKALFLGFSPLKLNVVILKGFNEDEVIDFASLTREYPLEVRFIEWMPLGGLEEEGNYYVPNTSIKEQIEKDGALIPQAGSGSGPASLFSFLGVPGKIGFINPFSGCFCEGCNRLRLTSEGQLRPCLAQDIEYDLKGLLRGGASLREVREELRRILRAKPRGHQFYSTPVSKSMFKIGG